MITKIKAVLFARVSTREQMEEGYSLQAQEKLIRDYAQRKEFYITKTFSIPESASGKQERKLFNELLDYIYLHPEITVVVSEKVDRITRNFKDAVKLQDWLEEDQLRQIHFVKQNLVIHKNSRSNDQFMWDMFLVLARQYSNNLSEETKKGLEEKALEGWFPGNHKRGYKTVGEIGHKVWVVDENIPDAKYIEMAFVMYNTGNYTLRTLAKELYKQGWVIRGNPISTSELHVLLTDPFYGGEFNFNNKRFNGKHKAIISRELFQSVQDRLQRKIKAGKYRSHSYLFGGLTSCAECGRSVTWEVQRGHIYGHCTQYKTGCRQTKYLKEEKIEEQVLDSLNSFKIQNPRLLEWIRKALKESHRDESEFHSDTIGELEKKKKLIESRLDKLYDERLDEKVSKDFYERKREQYEKELEVLISSIDSHTKANIDYQKLGMNIFELSQMGCELYEKQALLSEKRELLNFVFSNIKIRDEKVVPSFKNGFQVVAERAKDGNWLRDMDSNHGKRIQSPLSYR